jgi:hypothetical protein
MEIRVFNNPKYKERRRRKRLYMKQFQDALVKVGDIDEPEGSPLEVETNNTGGT